MLLQRQIVLEYFVLVGFVVHCAHQILKASNVDFVVQNSLQILKINFLGKNGIELGLICLSVQGLGHSCFVCLVGQLGFDLNELRIDLLLETGVVTLRRRASADLSQALQLVEDVFNPFFQTPRFLFDKLH